MLPVRSCLIVEPKVSTTSMLALRQLIPDDDRMRFIMAYNHDIPDRQQSPSAKTGGAQVELERLYHVLLDNFRATQVTTDVQNAYGQAIYEWADVADKAVHEEHIRLNARAASDGRNGRAGRGS